VARKDEIKKMAGKMAPLDSVVQKPRCKIVDKRLIFG
jgi:hypothetical protein